MWLQSRCCCCTSQEHRLQQPAGKIKQACTAECKETTSCMHTNTDGYAANSWAKRWRAEQP